MYLKLNCQNRERRQSIQNVARRSGVCEKHVPNGLQQVVTTMQIGEMQQQQQNKLLYLGLFAAASTARPANPRGRWTDLAAAMSN
jgi:hypothetical protein